MKIIIEVLLDYSYRTFMEILMTAGSTEHKTNSALEKENY